MRTVVLTLIGMVFGIGCVSTIPPPNFSVQNVSPFKEKINNKLNNISVVVAQPSEQTVRKVDIASFAKSDPSWGNIPLHWENALKNAILKFWIQFVY